MRLIRALYFSVRVWLALIGLVLALVLAYAVPVLLPIVQLALLVFVILLIADGIALFRTTGPTFFARRDVPDRLSNGDDNPLTIFLENRYGFLTHVEIVDEIPVQFQRRDVLFQASLKPGETQAIRYQLRPTRRGEYSFGAVNVYVKKIGRAHV